MIFPDASSSLGAYSIVAPSIRRGNYVEGHAEPKQLVLSGQYAHGSYSSVMYVVGQDDASYDPDTMHQLHAQANNSSAVQSGGTYRYPSSETRVNNKYVYSLYSTIILIRKFAAFIAIPVFRLHLTHRSKVPLSLLILARRSGTLRAVLPCRTDRTCRTTSIGSHKLDPSRWLGGERSAWEHRCCRVGIRSRLRCCHSQPV